MKDTQKNKDIEYLADNFHFHSEVHWSLCWLMPLEYLFCDVCRFNWKRRIAGFIRGR